MNPHTLARTVLAIAAGGAGASRSEAQPLAPAAYTPPPPGTRYVFTDLVNTVTKNDGWRTFFTDAQGRTGLRIGTFIPDNAASPLTIDEREVAKLWPLRLGARADVETRRGPLKWRWRIAVVDTETVTVPAGTFKTYVVEATETPVVTAIREPRVGVTTFWYAPSAAAVVRFKSGQLVGPRQGYPVRQELVRVERTPVAKAR